MARRSRSADGLQNQPDLFSLVPEMVAEPRTRNVSPERPQPSLQPESAVASEASLETRTRKPLVVSKPKPMLEARPGHLLDVRSAAAWLGLSKSTLDKMRCYGLGPKFIRASGKAVRYDPADLKAFAEGRRQSRTSDQFTS